MKVTCCEHPLLYAQVLRSIFLNPLGELDSTLLFSEWFSSTCTPPVTLPETMKTDVRDMFRHGGFKPAGRSKPSSEYLQKALEKQSLPSINAAVDICNIVSLHSGIPISVVDANLLSGDLSIRIAPPETDVVFNPSGQVLKMDGLVSLWDDMGPSACGVKDSQRTKTSANTRELVTVLWGPEKHRGRVDEACAWFKELLGPFSSEIQSIPCVVEGS